MTATLREDRSWRVRRAGGPDRLPPGWPPSALAPCCLHAAGPVGWEGAAVRRSGLVRSPLRGQSKQSKAGKSHLLDYPVCPTGTNRHPYTLLPRTSSCGRTSLSRQPRATLARRAGGWELETPLALLQGSPACVLKAQSSLTSQPPPTAPSPLRSSCITRSIPPSKYPPPPPLLGARHQPPPARRWRPAVPRSSRRWRWAAAPSPPPPPSSTPRRQVRERSAWAGKRGCMGACSAWGRASRTE